MERTNGLYSHFPCDHNRGAYSLRVLCYTLCLWTSSKAHRNSPYTKASHNSPPPYSDKRLFLNNQEEQRSQILLEVYEEEGLQNQKGKIIRQNELLYKGPTSLSFVL